MKKVILFLALGGMLMTCSDDDEQEALLNIDPSDAEALAKEITFTPSTTKINGLPPAPSTGANPPVITNNTSVSVVASGTVYIPITFTAPSSPSTLVIQVIGATTFYFSVPLPSTGTAGTLTIPMTISSRVLTGDFALNAFLVSGTELSEPMYIPATVTEPRACDDGFVQGYEGVTNTRHQLGGTAGNASLTFNTYTAPDRIDVFVDGVWKAGTGSSISPPPPVSDCGSPGAGFVGATGTLTIPVTSSSKSIDVYVSGCLGASTVWDYTLTCP